VLRFNFLRNNDLVDSPLKRRRLRMGLTQEAMADLCGINRRTYEGYEQIHRKPGKTHLQKLIAVTGLPWDALSFPEDYLRNHPEEDSDFAERAAATGRPTITESSDHLRQ
jgi:transcriptional regulator with XRE-family HTH domain